MSMRAFIGIEPSREFVGEVADVARQLSPFIDARYVPRANYHVTVAFLGELEERRVPDVVGCMERACGAVEPTDHICDALGSAEQIRDAVEPAEHICDAGVSMERARDAARSVELIPDGIGKFGRARNTTLWLGLAKTQELMSLAEDVRSLLDAASIDFDRKGFLPHITIARHAAIPDIPLPPLVFPQPAAAIALTLFKSTLSKEGASYKPLHSIPL